jgi:Outer membrane protein beta-barrel domain
MLQQLSRYTFAAFTVIATAALGSDVLAQPADDAGYLGVKTGANIERAEDGLAGESVGIGLEAGLALTRNWALDFEVWAPAYFETERGEHRDVLFNVTAIRSFRKSGARPFVVIGAGFGRVQQRLESQRFDSSETYLVFGGGVQIPVSTRLAIVPEVRVNYAIAALIVRPQVGLRVRF